MGSGKFSDRSGNFNNDGSEPDNSILFTLPKAKNTNTTPVAYNEKSQHYYQLAVENALWKDALALASEMSYRGLGGYLATSATQGENDFIVWVSLTFGSSNRVWLSISDKGTDGTWRFASGPEKNQVLDFLNWDTGEPNGGVTQNYGALYPYSAYDAMQYRDWETVIS